MEIKLAVPLSAEQIKAATDCWQLVERWQLIARSLCLLDKKVPGFSPEACLLKVTTLNAIYSTNIKAVVRMAEHVHSELSKQTAEKAEVELVERLAILPPAREAGRSRNNIVFASKFAHFFIDAESFPLRDSIALKMLKYHFGSRNYKDDRSHPYVSFVTHFHKLKEICQLTVSNRELDQYLWLAGQYRKWKKNLKGINSDALDLFQKGSPLLEAMLPPNERRAGIVPRSP
jgi:hypothetical protein